MDPEQIKALIEAIKAQDGAAALEIAEAMLINAAGDGSAAPESAPEVDALAAVAEPVPTEEAAALTTALTTLTGCTGVGEQVVALTKLIAEGKKAADTAAALDLSSRVELVGELVKLGVELPAHAWTGEGKDRKPCVRLSAEPLADLRARVAGHKAAGTKPRGYVPPTPAAEVVTLSAFDAAQAKKAGMTAEQFTAAKKNAVKRA